MHASSPRHGRIYSDHPRLLFHERCKMWMHSNSALPSCVRFEDPSRKHPALKTQAGNIRLGGQQPGRDEREVADEAKRGTSGSRLREVTPRSITPSSGRSPEPWQAGHRAGFDQGAPPCGIPSSLTGISICLYKKSCGCSVQPVWKHVNSAFRIGAAALWVGR